MQTYIEQEKGGKGALVEILVVHSSNVNTESQGTGEYVSTAEQELNYRVLSTNANSEWVTFTLGSSNPYKKSFPRSRLFKNFCRYRYVHEGRCQLPYFIDDDCSADNTSDWEKSVNANLDFDGSEGAYRFYSTDADENIFQYFGTDGLVWLRQIFNKNYSYRMSFKIKDGTESNYAYYLKYRFDKDDPLLISSTYYTSSDYQEFSYVITPDYEINQDYLTAFVQICFPISSASDYVFLLCNKTLEMCRYFDNSEWFGGAPGAGTRTVFY